MKRVWTLACKDLLLLWRQPVALFWVLGYPLLMAILFGVVFSGGGRARQPMVLLVANEDGGKKAEALVAALSREKALKLEPRTLPQAQDEVRRGKATAYLRICKGFSDVSLFSFHEQPYLELGMDPRRQAEAGLLEGLISKAWFSQMGQAMSDPQSLVTFRAELERWLPQVPSALAQPLQQLAQSLEALGSSLQSMPEDTWAQGNPFAQSPLRRVEVIASRQAPPNSFAVTFAQASLWALLAAVLGFSHGLVREKAAGTWLRLRMAPLPPAEVIAGKFLACLVASFTALVFLWVVAANAFRIHLGLRWFWLLAVLAIGSFCFSALMLLIATLGTTEEAVTGWGWATLLVLAMLGGGMIPLMFMPPWLATASKVNPAQWFVLALEGATWRGFSPQELLPYLGLLGITGTVLLYWAAFRLSRQY